MSHDKSEEMKLLQMALGNAAVCLGDALAIFNKLAGEKVFKNASAPSSEAKPVAWLSPDKQHPEIIETTARSSVAADWKARGWEVIPLYEHPPKP